MAVTPTLSAFSASATPGDGVCVFFFDSEYEFFPAGIGSSLGYTNYVGPVGFGQAAGENTAVNGVRGAYVGVGFDAKGNFANTTDGKAGNTATTSGSFPYYGNVATTAVSGASANSITIRGGEEDQYKILSTTENLTQFPLQNTERYKSSPALSLHQTVSSRDDVTFHRIRVSLENNSKRVRVDIQDPTSKQFYSYQVLDLDTLSLSASPPDKLRVGLAFATSDSFTNCEIKNFSVYGRGEDFVLKDQLNLEPLSAVSINVQASD